MVGLANGFAAAGHDVELVLVRAEGPYLSQVDPRLKIVCLNRSGVLASLVPLVRHLRRERPDALLSAMSHANIVAIVARALARVRTRIVISERTDAAEMVRRLGRRSDRFVLRLMRLTYRHADTVVVVARALVARMEELGVDGSRVTAIYNPVASTAIGERASEIPDHPWLRDTPSRVILAAGRLAPEKDFATLLRAFARLKPGLSARLVIIGEGRERAMLEDLARELGIADRVSLPGFVDNPYACMRCAAMFVLSSQFEGLPGVLIEAMACGTPVVSTDCSTGPAEILEGGRWGRLVPVGDPSALAEAISATLRSRAQPDVRERAGHFDSATAVSRYLEVLLPAGPRGNPGTRAA